MALTAQGWVLNVELVDYAGDTTSRTYHLIATDDAGDMTDVNTAVADILDRLDDVTLAGVKSYRVAKVFVETALDLADYVDAEVSEHAIITREIAGLPNKSGTVDIPAPGTIFVGTTGPAANVVDMENAQVLAYVGIFTDAGNLATISDGEQLANNGGSGIRTHSKSRG